MKKVSKRVLSVMLAVTILFTAFVPSFALDDASYWNYLWDAEYDNGVILFPGSNETEMNVSWYDSKEGEPKVYLDSDRSFDDAKVFTGECVKTYDGDYACTVTITGLEAGKGYYYYCESGMFESDDYYFETDENSNEFSALYMTDIHISYDSNDTEGENDELKRTAKLFYEITDEALDKHEDISIILSTGDQASSGLQSEYKAFSTVPAVKSVPVATTIGNHDRKGVAYKTFGNKPNEQKDAMVSSYIGGNYWFTKGDVLFLVMDSNNASGIDHRRFVKEAVKANPDAKWKIMMAHHDLYSGRIPHRESENALLRLLWAPIADEFGIDLVLLGHSHYYTVTNVLYNNKTVQPYAETMTDPEGTVYMVSGSISRPRDDDDIGLNEDWIGAYNTPDDRQIYNVLDFTENTVTVSSYYKGEETAFNKYTIAKSDNDGGHPDKITPLYNPIIRFIGTVYGIFNNIGVYDDLTNEYGFDVNFFDVVF